MDTTDTNYRTIPSFESLLANRLQPMVTTNGSFDPCASLVKRKQRGEDTVLPAVQQWPEEEIKALEDYCKKIGLIGFSLGKLSPRMTLNMLKSKFGDFTGIPLENRIPMGFEKICDKNEKDLLCG